MRLILDAPQLTASLSAEGRALLAAQPEFSRLETLAELVRRGFEPLAGPDPTALAAAAPVVIELYERTHTDLHRSLREE